MIDETVLRLRADEMNYRIEPVNVSAAGECFEISPGICYSLQVKPNAWHRFWSFVLLGWKWKEKAY